MPLGPEIHFVQTMNNKTGIKPLIQARAVTKIMIIDAFVASRPKPAGNDQVPISAPTESDDNLTSASETYGYYSEKSSATLTCDDYTERAKADLLGVFGPEDWRRLLKMVSSFDFRSRLVQIGEIS